MKGLIVDAMRGMTAECDPEEWAGWEVLAPHCVSHLRLADDKNIASVVITGPAVVLPGRPPAPVLICLDENPEYLVLPTELAINFLLKAGRYWELEETASCLLRWQRIIFGQFAIQALATEAQPRLHAPVPRRHASAARTYPEAGQLLPRDTRR